MKTTRIDLATISPRDALDLAVLVEEEARERYGEFAEQMKTHRNDEARRFFEFMAENEEKHRAALAARRLEEFGEAEVAVTREMIFDVEAPEYGEVRLFTTVREALETALRSEQKAHQFFVAARAQAVSPAAQALFEELEREELHHQALVHEQLGRLPPDSALTAEDYADEPHSID